MLGPRPGSGPGQALRGGDALAAAGSRPGTPGRRDDGGTEGGGGPGLGMAGAGSDNNASNVISACVAGSAGTAGGDCGGGDALVGLDRRRSVAVRQRAGFRWWRIGDKHPRFGLR